MTCGCEDRRKDFVRAASALSKADWAAFRQNMVNAKNSARADAERLARERIMNIRRVAGRTFGNNIR